MTTSGSKSSEGSFSWHAVQPLYMERKSEKEREGERELSRAKKKS